MLNTALNTNEVKDSLGAEVEFQRYSSKDRSIVFAKIGESPSLPHRLSIQHQEIGTGLRARRRSVIRVDLTTQSDVDPTTNVTTSAYLVLDAPVGALTANTPMKNTLANIMSFVSTTGAATTVLFDGTGNGSAALLSGSI